MPGKLLPGPIAGPPAAQLAAILRADKPVKPGDQHRATFTTSTNFPDLPSLMTEVVAMPQSATLDANVEITGILTSSGWATEGIAIVQQAYTPAPSDAVILANASAAGFTVTLPDATQTGFATGQRYTIIKTDATSNSVTVAASAGQTIAGGSTLTLTATNAYTGVLFDGSNWQVWAGVTTVSSTPSGAAGGDLSGTYPNPGVAKIGGISVTGTPSTSYTLAAVSNIAAAWSAPGSFTGSVDWFNIKDQAYKAQVNGQEITNGVMASGSSTLTSASNPFIAADVGKTIYVYGAAASSGVLATTIATYNSAGSVTLNAANASGGAVSSAYVFWATDDTAAVQAAVNAALAKAKGTPAGGINSALLTPTVFIPFGNCLVTSPINFGTSGTLIRITGNWGSRIFSGASGIFDFQNHGSQGFEIDHLTLDATGGHIFANPSLKFCYFHHLYLVQRSPNYCWMQYSQAGGGMQETAWSDIQGWACADPVTNTRSVAAMQLYPQAGAVLAGVTFDRFQCNNYPGVGGGGTPRDTTQYCFDIQCQGTSSSSQWATNIRFNHCTFNRYFGGCIKVLSGANIGISNCKPDNLTTDAGSHWANAAIYIGKYSGNSSVSKGIRIRDYQRGSGALPTPGSEPSDIYIESTTLDVRIDGATDSSSATPTGPQVNLNGAAGAVISSADSSLAVLNPNDDTIIINAGVVSAVNLEGLLPSGDTTGATDTSNIQAAMTAASASGTAVTLGSGTFYTNAALQWPKSTAKGASLIGAGMGITVIKPVSGALFNAVQTQPPPTNVATGYIYHSLMFRDFTIDCSNVTGTTAGQGNGLYLFGGIECHILRVEVTNSPNWGIVLDSTAANDCYWSWVEDCLINGCAGGIMPSYNTACTLINNVIPNYTGTCAAVQPLYGSPQNTQGWNIYTNSQNTRMFNNVIGSSGTPTTEAVRTANVENEIIGNYFITTDTTCLHCAGNCDIVVGNTFEKPCTLHAAVAVILGSDTTFTANAFSPHTNYTGLATYLVQGSGNNVAVVGNIFPYSGSSGYLNIQSGALWQVVGNTGYDDILIESKSVVQNSDFPGINGLLAWTWDLLGSGSGTSVTPTGGTLYLQGFGTSKTITVSKVWWAQNTAGSGATSGQNFLALYNSSGTLLGSVQDDTIVTAAQGVQSRTITVAGGQSLTISPGTYYVGLVVNASGLPKWESGQANGSFVNFNGVIRNGTGGSVTTALPAPATVSTASNQSFWAGVS